MTATTCIHCDRPGSYVCDLCLDIACEIVEANRRRFNRLISAGVDREMANRIMIDRNRGGPSS